MRHIERDKMEAEHMYLDEKLSVREVADKFGYSYGRMRLAFSRWGTPIRKRGEYRIKGDVVLDEETLWRVYWDEKKSYDKIAAELGCTKRYVQSRMQSLGIPRRSRRRAVVLSVEQGRASSWTDERREELKVKYLGENNPNWKGGATRRSYVGRVTSEYIEWRRAVYERDAYTCAACGDDRGGNLCAHHVTNYAKVAGGSEEHAVHNGITLCENCHAEFHARFGNMNNDLGQFCEFLNVAVEDAYRVLHVRQVTDIVVRKQSKKGPRSEEAVADVRGIDGLAKAFWKKVKKDGGCWVWGGAIDEDHGRFSFKQNRYCAHRVAWELVHGPLVPNKNIRHTCGNRACVNPGHLEFCRDRPFCIRVQ